MTVPVVSEMTGKGFSMGFWGLVMFAQAGITLIIMVAIFFGLKYLSDKVVFSGRSKSTDSGESPRDPLDYKKENLKTYKNRAEKLEEEIHVTRDLNRAEEKVNKLQKDLEKTEKRAKEDS